MLRSTSAPHVAVLGRIPGTRRYSDHERHPENEPTPDVLIVRPESSLLYFNVENVCDAILERVDRESSPPKLVVLDLSAGPRIDLHGATALGGLADQLAQRGIRIQAVETRSAVRDRLRAMGVDAKLSGISRTESLADVVEAFGQGDSGPPTLPPSTTEPSTGA